MDVLKRELAPISVKAWEEIDRRAKEVLKNYLSARKFVRVNGPMGLDFTSVTEGRIEVHSDELLNYGIYSVRPLIEPRVSFKLGRWELDNIERGAKDINLDALDEAVKNMAQFEEKVVFNGLEDACIKGILESSPNKLGELGDTESEILANVTKGVMILERAIAEKPYVLVVSEEVWCKLNALGKEVALVERIKNIVGGDIIVSRSISGAVLIPFDNENIELTIGEDFSIGYQEHGENYVKLFVTETLTFRILDETIIVSYS
jgi:uncharacterized linocin/CFP29 family protein